MKEKLFLLFLFISIDLFSQHNISGGFKFGISLPNVSLNNKLPNTSIEISNNTGFNAGIFVNIISAGRYNFSSELYYNQSFVNVKSANTYYHTVNNTDYKVEYIVYGLISKYHFTISTIIPYLLAGPELSFYIADNSTSSTYSIPSGTQIQISDNINKTIFSFALGAGFEIKTSKKTAIIAEVQFAPGLMNTYEEESVSAKTNSLELKTGILINF